MNLPDHFSIIVSITINKPAILSNSLYVFNNLLIPNCQLPIEDVQIFLFFTINNYDHEPSIHPQTIHCVVKHLIFGVYTWKSQSKKSFLRCKSKPIALQLLSKSSTQNNGFKHFYLFHFWWISTFLFVWKLNVLHISTYKQQQQQYYETMYCRCAVNNSTLS